MLKEVLKEKVKKCLEEISKKGYSDPYEDIIITNCEVFLSNPREYQIGVMYFLERKYENNIYSSVSTDMGCYRRIFEIDESILDILGPFLISTLGIKITITSSSKLLNVTLKDQTVKSVYIDFFSKGVSISLDADLKNL